MSSIFNVPSFIVCFRETAEVSVVVSSLLLLVNAMLQDDLAIMKKVKLAIWLGLAAGLALTVLLAAGILSLIASVGPEAWGRQGSLWEGCLALVGVLFMTLFAFGTMRTKDPTRMDSKFMNVISNSIRSGRKSRLYPLFLLPFITVAREGLETIVFIVGLSGGIKEGWRAIPLPVVIGVLSGALLGVVIRYLGAEVDHSKLMFVLSITLIVMASALMAKAAWSFEFYKWGAYLSGDGDEGPGIKYDLSRVTFVLDCCDPRTNENIWGILQTFVGWNNVSYNSIHWSYFFYWVVVILAVLYIKYKDRSLRVIETRGKLMDSGTPLGTDDSPACAVANG